MLHTNDTNAEDILRPMHCELHALTRSDGSALLTQGLNKISFWFRKLIYDCNR